MNVKKRSFHPPRIAEVFVAFFLVGLLVTLPSSCRSVSSRAIPLTDSHNAPHSISARTDLDEALLVAIAPVISPQETLSAYGDLVAVLGRMLGRPTRVVQRSTYAETNQLIRDRLCDVAFVCSLSYVRGRDEFGMRALVVPQVRGKTTYQSYIIVAESSPARSIEDLRGHSFAFVDPLSNTGWLSPVALLESIGERPETFFSSTVFTHSHDHSIRAVANHLVDGAAVDSLVYEYLAVHQKEARGTRIIWKSRPCGMPPVVTPPGLPDEERSRLRDAFLRLHQDKQGRRVLDRLMIDRFVLPTDVDYSTIEDMLGRVGNSHE